MANEQNRRSFIEKVIGGAVTLIGMILAIRLDQRQAEKHEWERVDRRQDRLVEIQGTSHAHSASQAAMIVTRETIPI